MAEPSDTELEILKLLWDGGEMTVRQVQDQAAPALGWADSTTRTVLDRMAGKGLVKRRQDGGLAVYAAADRKVEVLGRALKKFAREVLEIDGPVPASAFTGSQLLSADDLKELDAILNAEDPEGPKP